MHTCVTCVYYSSLTCHSSVSSCPHSLPCTPYSSLPSPSSPILPSPLSRLPPSIPPSSVPPSSVPPSSVPPPSPSFPFPSLPLPSLPPSPSSLRRGPQRRRCWQRHVPDWLTRRARRPRGKQERSKWRRLGGWLLCRRGESLELLGLGEGIISGSVGGGGGGAGHKMQSYCS